MPSLNHLRCNLSPLFLLLSSKDVGNRLLLVSAAAASLKASPCAMGSHRLPEMQPPPGSRQSGRTSA